MWLGKLKWKIICNVELHIMTEQKTEIAIKAKIICAKISFGAYLESGPIQWMCKI